MKLSKYISVPQSQRTQSTAYYGDNTKIHYQYRYLSFFQILISLLSAIIVICFRLINFYVVTKEETYSTKMSQIDTNTLQTSKQSQINTTITTQNNTNTIAQQKNDINLLEILYPLSIVLLLKSIIVINYICRSKTKKVGHLEKMAKISILDLLIPGFLKSIYYISMMVSTIYFQNLVFFIVMVISTVCLQILNWRLFKRKKIGIFQKQTKSRSHFQSYKYRFPFRDIITEILLLTALFLTCKQMNKQSVAIDMDLLFCAQQLLKYTTIILVMVVCTISYYYFHSRIFQLYETDIDQLISKQYIIQIANLILIATIYSIYQYTQTLQTQKQQSTQKIFFGLEYPIHTLIVFPLSILYEYLCFQMLKKQNLKKLHLTQLTSLLWINFYLLLKDYYQQLTLELYIAILLSIMGMIALLRVFNVEKLMEFINKRQSSKNKNGKYRKRRRIKNKYRNSENNKQNHMEFNQQKQVSSV